MARRIRAQDYNGNTFFTSSTGVLKLEGPTLLYKPSGLPRGLDLTLTLDGVTGFLDVNKSVSYRLVWGIRDANNNYIYGPPSSRFVIKNTAAATRNVQLTFNIPQFITTAHFFQVYRSRAVDSTGAGVITDPGDELYLCYERNPTAAEIAAKAVTAGAVIDTTPESILAGPLYTNATQEGIINENTAPPYCRDICLYRDHMIYAYTQIFQNLNINMIGVGFALGQTITIAGTTYTAAAAENTAVGNFFRETTLGTVSLNIEYTAKSLVNVINKYTVNTRVYAYYVSAFGEVPGKIYIESRTLGDTTWTVTCSAGMSLYWEPQLPTTATALFTSSNDDTANAIIISKFQQPEHVPYINKFTVGAKNEAIQRVVALRDSVIIFKDNSIWRMVGTSLNNFQISLLDNTVSIISRDSVATLNNVVYALTNQGVVSVSDNGVQIVGRQIEYDMIANVRYMVQNNLQDDPVGIGQESDRIYVLTVTSAGDGPLFSAGKRITYVYNAFSQAWTRWYLAANCYAILDDRIYYGHNNNTGVILEQRIGYADKTATFPVEFEFCDPEGSLNITAIGPAANQVTGTFTDGVNWTGSIDSPAWPTTVQPGWVILDQANSKKYIVLSVAGNVYTLNSNTGLGVAAYSIYRPIRLRTILSPRVFNQPFQLKQFTESYFDLSTMSAYSFNVYFYNEEDYRDEPISTFFEVQTTATTIVLSDFETTTLNAKYYPHNIKRTYVDKNRSIGTRLFIELFNGTAGSRFDINAVGLDVRALKSSKVSQ